MKRVYDISIPIRTGGLVYPGNPAIEIAAQQAISEGAGANVSLISFGSHTGTHVDAAKHFFDDGETIDHIDPARFIGPAIVIAMDDSTKEVTAADLEQHDRFDAAAQSSRDGLAARLVGIRHLELQWRGIVR